MSSSEGLGWLWGTMAATTCWAASDVMCDACIRPALTAEEEGGRGASQAAVAQPDGTAGAKSPRHVPKVLLKEPTAETLTSPRSRVRLPSITQLPVAFALESQALQEQEQDGEGSTGGPLVAEQAAAAVASAVVQQQRQQQLRRRRQANSLSPLLSPQHAPSLPMSPLASPLLAKAAIPVSPPGAGVGTGDSGQKLSPEQNALVSGVLSMFVGVFLAHRGALGLAAVLPMPPIAADARCALAALGGVFHFLAYLSTLCAFSSAPSTVITPLMQLSAVWMLPFSTLAAMFGHADFIRPVHLLSVVFICIGGFLPAAHGSLSELLTPEFWQQRAVRFVILGELLICIYNLILHQCTFDGGAGGAAAVAAAATTATTGGTSDLAAGNTLRFFLLSRLGNGTACLLLFLGSPALRAHAVAFKDVHPRYLVVSVAGECLSILGVCLVTFSYSSFYEPSVVNAAEGGLQQLFNLLFALVSSRIFGMGRKVEQLTVKFTSFVLVTLGLMLSVS